jgi:hypothetical protein
LTEKQSRARDRINGQEFLSFLFWAFFRRIAPETGLSALMFLAGKPAQKHTASIPNAYATLPGGSRIPPFSER